MTLLPRNIIGHAIEPLMASARDAATRQRGTPRRSLPPLEFSRYSCWMPLLGHITIADNAQRHFAGAYDARMR